jgi:hypothetical protein
MIHAFLLVVLLNGEIDSQSMYFASIDRCNYFASALTRRIRTAEPPTVIAYCVPRLVNKDSIQPELY